jgi:hypothetical protein
LSVDFHWKSVNDGVCCPDQRAVVTHSLECVKAASQFFFRVCRKLKIWVWSISRSVTRPIFTRAGRRPGAFYKQVGDWCILSIKRVGDLVT